MTAALQVSEITIVQIHKIAVMYIPIINRIFPLALNVYFVFHEISPACRIVDVLGAFHRPFENCPAALSVLFTSFKDEGSISCRIIDMLLLLFLFLFIVLENVAVSRVLLRFLALIAQR